MKVVLDTGFIIIRKKMKRWVFTHGMLGILTP